MPTLLVRTTRWLLAALLALPLLAACTAPRLLGVAGDGSWRAQVTAGEPLVVTLADGSVHAVTYVEPLPDGFVGEQRNGSRRRFLDAEVSRVTREERGLPATGRLGGGLGYGLRLFVELLVAAASLRVLTGF